MLLRENVVETITMVSTACHLYGPWRRHKHLFCSHTCEPSPLFLIQQFLSLLTAEKLPNIFSPLSVSPLTTFFNFLITFFPTSQCWDPFTNSNQQDCLFLLFSNPPILTQPNTTGQKIYWLWFLLSSLVHYLGQSLRQHLGSRCKTETI